MGIACTCKTGYGEVLVYKFVCNRGLFVSMYRCATGP